jgi:hypothetical protein
VAIGIHIYIYIYIITNLYRVKDLHKSLPCTCAGQFRCRSIAQIFTVYMCRSIQDHGMLVMQSNQKPEGDIRFRKAITLMSSSYSTRRPKSRDPTTKREIASTCNQRYRSPMMHLAHSSKNTKIVPRNSKPSIQRLTMKKRSTSRSKYNVGNITQGSS